MEFTVRGKCQEVQRIDYDDVTLHDPLLVSVVDFDRRALDQLAHALHLTVTRTYNHAPGINKSEFFKEGNEYVNPSRDQAGRDVYYLLKNIHYHVEDYAKLLVQSEDDVTETVVFLLEGIRNQMAHQTYLNCDSPDCELTKRQKTERCLEECKELLQWIVNAPFYGKIRERVQMILNNMINMTTVFEDFKKVKQSIKDRDSKDDYATDTDKAIERLQNLLEALQEEQCEAVSIEDRPLTHFINMVVAPRLKETH